MTLYQAYAGKHGTTVIPGVSQLDYQNNSEVFHESTIGSPFVQLSAIMAQKPRIQIPTTALATVLGITGSTGATIDGASPFVAFFAKLADNGMPAAGSVHRSYTATRGLLLPRKLSCSHRSFAVAEIEALLRSTDGAAHPIAIADNAALPTIPRDNVKFSLGPIQLGTTGSQLTEMCLQNLDIDFGSAADTLGCNSDIYDTHLEVPGIKSTVMLTGLSGEAFGSTGVPALGKRCEHNATTIYLRKRTTDGLGYVANATAEHIKLTINGLAVVESHNGSGNKRSEVRLKIYCDWDGTLAPITINTASAIT